MHGKGNMKWNDGSSYTGQYKMGEYDAGVYESRKGKK